MTHSIQTLLPQPLDPGVVELAGINLIEASAGTGKTYNITALFLRALLAFRDSAKELAIPNVLVVTFTDAATQELRERIRSRLRAAIQALEQGQCDSGDLFLQGLLDDRSSAEHAELARYLTAQLRRFDEASIFTIHGFCQRVLQEHGFDTGSLFELELAQDDSGLIRDAVDDVWRRQLHDMDAELAAYLVSKNVTPAQLAKDVRLVLSKPRSVRYPALLTPPEADSLTQLKASYVALRQCWRACHAQLREQLLEAQSVYAKNRVLGTRPGSLFPAAHLFFSTDEFAFNTHDLEALKYFRITEIAKVKKGQVAPVDEHGFFQQCEDFLVAAEGCGGALDIRLQQFKQDFYRQAEDCLRGLKQQRQLRSFDDLLNDVARALENNLGLAELLHQRYPVALIDEFQDTDPVQYGIFEKIYHPRGGTLFMIGDPKQAIYGFRGGDIFTYIEAREKADSGRAYTLGENHRSVRGLVEGVNHLFADRDGLPTFGHAAIPYLPVAAKGAAADHLTTLEGQPLAPIRLMAVPGEPMKTGPARRFIAEQTAFEIARMLDHGQAGRLLLHDRPLQSADIAVLVRKHEEGRLMREALSACGIRSVEYSQDSLFDSDEARELEAILRAAVDPGDRDALPTALATRIMGQSAMTALAVKQGEAAWEQWYHRFLHYQELWHRQGVAAMLQQLLHEPGSPEPAIAEKILMEEGGERRLTNVLHLLEVLQETANQEQLSAAGLVKWLGRQRDQALRIGEARELRLESDEGLVKIITVHKSKGLQFPIVFCPFLWGTRQAASSPFAFHTQDGQAALELGFRGLPDYAEDYRRHQGLARMEAEQEEMRLLYVALTRAQYQCHIAFGAIGGNSKPADSAKSTLARLLRLDRADFVDSDAVASALERLCTEQPDIFATVRLPQARTYINVITEQARLDARQFQGRISRDWQITSYSTLSRGHAERVLKADDDRAASAPIIERPSADFFGFTRGRQAGSFLHALLEDIDFIEPDILQLEQSIVRLAPRYGIDVEQWGDVVQKALLQIIATPLNGAGLSLGAVSSQDRLPELEFHYDLGSERDSLMLYLEQSGVEPGRWETPLRRLDEAPSAGLMTGFIDLTFRYKNKYYIADYKSNYLGSSYADYAPARLTNAMAAEAFDLQYLIYVLALHRYLGVRLPNYCYERDLGGAFYLFLRGMHPEHPGSGIYFDKPPKALVLALDRYFAAEHQYA